MLLRREGHQVNLKRVLRLYREENLKLRARKRKRVASTLRVKPEGPVAINQMWSMDFMHDTLNGGRRFRTLNIVDCFSRESLAFEVDTSLSGHRVVRVLQRLLEMRGKPQVIQVDNGPEFTGRALDEWAHKNQIKLHFIEPGKPTQNGVIESSMARCATSASTSNGSSTCITPERSSNTGDTTTTPSGPTPV